VSLLAVAAYVLFMAWLLTREGLRNGRSPVEVFLAAVAATAILSSLSDMETALVPFQVVLALSRMSYLVLLWGLCVAIRHDRPRLYAAVMLAAIPAVTFHGTGHLFALCIVLVHLMLRQGIGRLAIGLLPLATSVVVQSFYSVGGGELAMLGQVLSPSALIDVPLAFVAYFATPFVGFRHLVDSRVLLVPGAILTGTTIVLTLLGLRETLGLRSWSPAAWWRQYRHPTPDPAPNAGVAFFTIVGLLLLMSGAAAALFWFIRGRMAGLLPWELVIGTARYGAYATLAYLMPLAAFLHRPPSTSPRPVATMLSSLAASAVLLLGLAGSWQLTRTHVLDDRLNIALSGVATGISPILPGVTDEIWPDVGTEWFWKEQLPRTVAWLRATQTGPWRDLPPIGSRGGAAYAALPLNIIRREPIPGGVSPGHCRLTADLPRWGHAFPARSTIVPVSDGQGVVVGFATMTRRSAHRAVRSVEGFVPCPADGAAPLFVPDPGRA